MTIYNELLKLNFMNKKEFEVLVDKFLMKGQITKLK